MHAIVVARCWALKRRCNARFARMQKVRGFGVREKEGCVVGIVKHAFLSSTDQVLPDYIWVRRVANNLFGTSGDEFVRRFPGKFENSKIRNFSDRDDMSSKGQEDVLGHDDVRGESERLYNSFYLAKYCSRGLSQQMTTERES